MRPRIELANYEVTELLGKGGMGEVYRAHDPKLGRDVAIKLLPEALAADEILLGRLQREARALAALNHPNIATIHDLGQQDTTTFIVMELIEGVTLAERLGRGALPVAEAIDIARQIAQALDAAHARGIVHRDLKPANIKILPDGHVKVLDFGLAKRGEPTTSQPGDSRMVTDAVELTGAGTVMGTPPYMSPEQIRGEEIDERTDVWAFGCVLYEMLAGKRAFGRETPSDTLAAVLEAEPDGRFLPADLPEAVQQLVEATLTKDRQHRPSSMRDARITLEGGLRRLESGGHSLSGGLAAPRRQSGVGLGIIAGVAVLLAAAAGWYAFSSDEDDVPTAVPVDATANEARGIAVLPFETLGQAEATPFTQGVHVDMLTRLSRIPDLRVISRTSVMQYQSPDRPLPEIAAELGVTWVLLGEIQQAGDQVQVNARLVNALNDEQVWAQTYRRELTAQNLFDIQAELTERISAELQAQLTPQQQELGNSVPTRDLEAYRLYVEGRELLITRTADGMRAAADYFERAIARDPDYALAWVGLADALALLESYGHAPDEDLFPRGFEAADRALELQPDLGEAHASRSLLLSESGADASETLREMERAIELRPSYAEAHNWKAYGELLNGRPERALASAQRAVELDPLSLEAISNLALAEIALGRYAAGSAETQRIAVLGPEFATGRLYDAIALLHLDDAEAALERVEDLHLPWAGQGPLTLRGVAHARTGNTAAARAVLAQLQQIGHPIDVVIVSAALGRTDSAWATLERAENWPPWPRLAAYYLFPDLLDPLRADPRWAAIAPPVLELPE